MNYVRQFGIILAISFAGEVLNTLLPLPVPASIYGLVILFVCLQTRVVRLDAVRETGYFLIEIMPMMFIPAAVGLLESWSVLRAVWLPFCVITAVSTVVVMGISGRVTQTAIVFGRRRHTERENIR